MKFYTDEQITPTMLDIIKAAKQAVFGDEPVDFEPASAPGPGVLSFGKDARGGVRTLSLKQLAVASNAVSVLAEAFRLMRDGGSLPEPKIIRVPEWNAQAYIDEMLTRFDKPCVFDIENAPDESLLSIAVTYGGNQVVFLSHFEKVVQALGTHYYLIAHNGKYDQGVIRRQYGIKLPIWFDTMLARHVMHPTSQGRLGLKDLASTVLGISDYEADIKQYTSSGENADYSKIPKDRLAIYNGMDVYATFHLARQFLPLVQDNPAIWHAMSWSDALGDVENNQVKIDLDYLDVLEPVIKAEMEEAEALIPCNPRSPKQLLSLFHERGVFPKEKGKDSTSKAALEEIADTGPVDDFLPALMKYRKVSKQYSTYIKSYRLKHKDGFLRPTFNVHGTGSSRLSSSMPNAQNVPRDKKLRRIFIPREAGRVWIECDYAQAELRAQAILANDPAMIAAFQPDSADFFDALVPSAYPERFPTLETYLEYEDAECDGDEKDYRAKLKGVVYGLNFGRGARAIAKSLEMPDAEAQQIINGFMGAYPDWAEWREHVMHAATSGEDMHLLTAWTGYQFEREIITGRNRASVERSALSFMPQATVAGLCTTAVANVNRRLKAEYPEAYLVLAVHDAIYIDCPAEVAEPVCGLVQYEMEQIGRDVFGKTVIFSAEPKVLETWGGDRNVMVAK